MQKLDVVGLRSRCIGVLAFRLVARQLSRAARPHVRVAGNAVALHMDESGAVFLLRDGVAVMHGANLA
jgi:hypothetical protein